MTVATSPVPSDKANGRGVVYTRPWVVTMILDAVGYTPERDLARLHAVDPACGDGAFVTEMVNRLIQSCVQHGRPIRACRNAITAYDIDPGAVELARTEIAGLLLAAGLRQTTATALSEAWVRHGDYLLPGPERGSADIVVGNPPYVRLEHIDANVSERYRQRWDAMTGRADLYIGFMQAALTSLRPDGTLSFIAPDRWMRNQYGRRLREFVNDGYNLDLSVTLHDAQPFEEIVAAYPAVVVIRRGREAPSLSVDAGPAFADRQAEAVVRAHRRRQTLLAADSDYTAAWVPAPPHGSGSWPTGSPERLLTLRSLEEEFPALGDPTTGTRVGVGVATGADAVYITDDPNLVEPDRLLPLVFSHEVTSGVIRSQSRYLVNPWTCDGQLVDLDDFPRLSAYLHANQAVLRARHVARKRPTKWYRTIDHVDPTLLGTPKLVLPDLKARVHPVLETGHFYPQHNLFFVTAPEWDIEVLGGLLISDIATMFVEAYSVKMASGFLRVTAQYLRRIRIPRPRDVAPAHADQLREAFRQRDIPAANAAAQKVYRLPAMPGA